jgi:hypothetical protein
VGMSPGAGAEGEVFGEPDVRGRAGARSRWTPSLCSYGLVEINFVDREKLYNFVVGNFFV